MYNHSLDQHSTSLSQMESSKASSAEQVALLKACRDVEYIECDITHCTNKLKILFKKYTLLINERENHMKRLANALLVKSKALNALKRSRESCLLESDTMDQPLLSKD